MMSGINDVTIIDPIIKKVMDQQAVIIAAFDNGEYDKAHNMRDELYTETLKELIHDAGPRTKRTIIEIMEVLVGIDDWGV